MAVPLTIARKTVASTLKKISENKSFQQKLLGFGLPIVSYFAYEELTKEPDFPDPILPSKKPQSPLKSLASPTVKTPLDDVVKKVNENTSLSNKNLDHVFSQIEGLTDTVRSSNQSFLDTVKDSPFMANQVLTKDTLDGIALNMEAQTIMLGALWESLEKNLSALVAVKMVEAQNHKVNLDKQSIIAEKVDSGNFFYDFIPTSEYWAKVDSAYILYQKRNGWAVNENLLPSIFNSYKEIELIDRLEGYYSNSVIRGEVEAFRKENVDSSIRALIGQTALASEKSKAETEFAAKEYYQAAKTQIVQNTIPEALTSLTSAVAPIAGWAEKAKLREEFLTTVIPAVKDLDGNTVMENITPLAVTLAKDAAIAREKTDTINFEVDETDFPSMDFLPVLPFVGRESIYDPAHQTPSSNPFEYKSIV